MSSKLNGFIKLHRKMKEWGWYSDPVVKSVFLHILLSATFKPAEYKGYELQPGQAVIGRKKMATDLGLSEQQVRTALSKLESTKEISIVATNRFSVVTVENWRFYQDDDEESNQQSPKKYGNFEKLGKVNSKNPQKSTNKSTSYSHCNSNDYEESATNTLTNNQPTDNQQITNNQPLLKNEKNVKNEKKCVCTHARARGTFSNVFLTDDEYIQLSDRYSNPDEIIENLSNYKMRKGKNDDNHADFAWVLSFARKDGKPKSVSGKTTRNRVYEKCLNEAKLGFPPSEKETGLTDEQRRELTEIAEKVMGETNE